MIFYFSGIISVRKSLSGVKSDEESSLKVTASDRGSPVGKFFSVEKAC